MSSGVGRRSGDPKTTSTNEPMNQPAASVRRIAPGSAVLVMTRTSTANHRPIQATRRHRRSMNGVSTAMAAVAAARKVPPGTWAGPSQLLARLAAAYAAGSSRVIHSDSRKSSPAATATASAAYPKARNRREPISTKAPISGRATTATCTAPTKSSATRAGVRAVRSSTFASKDVIDCSRTRVVTTATSRAPAATTNRSRSVRRRA